MSGSKGIILVRDSNGDIAGIYCLKGFSFALGGNAYDSIGGFAELKDAMIVDLMAQRGILREIMEEAHIAEVSITVLHDLGSIYPDRGMTPNHPRIWAAEVTADIAIGGHKNTDPWEMDSQVFFIPYDQLWGKAGFIAKNDDAFFLSIIARLMATGILRQPAI